MIPTGSKFFYGLAALLAVAAVAYGYSSGGGGLGPISLGYKGGVGEHLGYGILAFASIASLFAGLCSNAFRDADPEPTAALLGTDALPAATPTGTSFWPIVGAFGVVLTVVGAVLNNVFFVSGLIVLGAVAIEWTMQAWSDRATGDPAVNREIRRRIMFPIEAPLAGALAIAVVVLGYSRVFLAVSQLGAVWIALAIAATIFAIGTALSLRPRIRTDLVAGLLAGGAVVTVGLGIFGAVTGEREFERHGEEADEAGEAEDSAESPDPVGAVDGEPEGIEEDEPTEDRGAVDGDSGQLGGDPGSGAVDGDDVSGGTSGGPSGGNASEDEADDGGAVEEN